MSQPNTQSQCQLVRICGLCNFKGIQDISRYRSSEPATAQNRIVPATKRSGAMGRAASGVPWRRNVAQVSGLATHEKRLRSDLEPWEGGFTWIYYMLDHVILNNPITNAGYIWLYGELCI